MAEVADLEMRVLTRLFRWKTDAILDAIKHRLEGRQETQEEQERARRVLMKAMDEDVRVFQAVLDAVSKEVFLPREVWFPCLTFALRDYGKEIVMPVVERMAKEAPYELDASPMDALFKSEHFDDQEVVNGVLSVMPPAALGAKPEDTDHQYYKDALDMALSCPEGRVQRAVELVMRFGPSMEERLEGQERFRYVRTAAAHGDLAVVETMHELIPFLADGSGRRGSERDYGYAIGGCRGVNARPILEFLMNKGGVGCLDECDTDIMFCLQAQDVEWVVGLAPLFLERACRRSDILYVLVWYLGTCKTDYYANMIAEMVDLGVIVKMMQQTETAESAQLRCHGNSWRYRLKVLHEKVPECMNDELRWRWLMEAIEDKAYKDVEYMAGMCDRGHLTRRNEEGETALDVAARDDGFPRELLDRVRVTTKGAHA